MRVDYAARTDVGRIRKENQDSYGVMEAQNFYMVCDGMGGGAAGDFASRCAVEVMMKSFELMKTDDINAVIEHPPVSIGEEFERPITALRMANRALYNLTQKYPKLTGMGTTAVAVLFDLQSRRLHMYHVGDSRLYRLRHGTLELLTKDHSKINELLDQGKMKEDDVKTAEIQSMITRALGTGAKVRVDYRSVELLPDDVFVMCTDGLNGEIDDALIQDIMKKNGDNMEAIATQLIDSANNAAGRDNTTVIALHFKDSDYGSDVTYPIPTQSVVTFEEETAGETACEDKLLKTVQRQVKVKVPKSARDKKLLNNPLVLGILLTALIVGVAFFPKKVMQANPDTKLTDLSGNLTGIRLDVRMPTDAELASFRRAEDSIQKLQLIQDWFKNCQTATVPLENVAVVITGNGKEQFKGMSSEKAPLDVPLPLGSCTIRLTYRNYRIITPKMELVGTLSSSVEPGATFKPVLAIMLPVNEGGTQSGGK